MEIETTGWLKKDNWIIWLIIRENKIIYGGFSLFMTGQKYFVGIAQQQEQTSCQGWKSSESGISWLWRNKKHVQDTWPMIRKHEIKKFQTGTTYEWYHVLDLIHANICRTPRSPGGDTNFHFGHHQPRTYGGWRTTPAANFSRKYERKTYFGEINSDWDRFWSRICFPPDSTGPPSYGLWTLS